MDQFDRAQELDARFRQQALRVHAKQQNKGASRMQCIDCDTPIPKARQKAAPGCQRCIRCEEEYEGR